GGKDLMLYTIGNIGVAGALYKSMEFSGEVIRRLPMDGRLTMCNMAIEAGAKNGIIAPDKTTLAYFNDGRRHRLSSRRSGRSSSFVSLSSDPDAQYEKVYTWDVSRLEPQVACPHLPGNVRAVGALKGIKLDQVVIGSCTNGRISDLRLAAKVLRGRRIARGLRCIVIPATQNIYLQAIKEGLIKIFVEAGAVVVTPTCGPCLGGHSGILAEGEACLATTNRNFVGRMGALKSRIYLSNPALAAASAIRGKITHPAEIGVRD
ncbi:MAG: aconitase family protein, partial [Candidatus Omnitrophota bacterium]